MRDEKVPMYDFPIPRYAHSFVYNPACDCYYMFGGNSGTMTQTSTNMMRLDDFWKMQVLSCNDLFYFGLLCTLLAADETKQRKYSEGVSIVIEEAEVHAPDLHNYR